MKKLSLCLCLWQNCQIKYIFFAIPCWVTSRMLIHFLAFLLLWVKFIFMKVYSKFKIQSVCKHFMYPTVTMSDVKWQDHVVWSWPDPHFILNLIVSWLTAELYNVIMGFCCSRAFNLLDHWQCVEIHHVLCLCPFRRNT